MTRKERSAAQSYFNDLCYMLGVPMLDPIGSFHIIELGARGRTRARVGWTKAVNAGVKFSGAVMRPLH